MIKIDHQLSPADLSSRLKRLWEISGQKIRSLHDDYDERQGAPVFTVKGRYTTRGWTEWTQGFQFGSALLQFDATGDETFLEMAKSKIMARMPHHLTHTGVHDHGFNTISTYGNLLRLMREGKIPENPWEKEYYTLALKVSGAVQAARWTKTMDGGYIYSFNGPHSLFVDTIRSCRILMIGHALGHELAAENDIRISLFDRAIQHMVSTATHNIYYGENRDAFDVRGRTAHESIFNVNDGRYRCPGSQQGYSALSTWTRGLAWAMCGFAEELEYLRTLKTHQEQASLAERERLFLKAARATCDFYIQNTPTDGIPYWDTGAPNLCRMGDYLARPADPFQASEPVDSSAAAIATQGLMRLGTYLTEKGEGQEGRRYWQAGLTVMRTLTGEPYLSQDPAHQGLLLHSVYHYPNGWDYIPPGSRIPYGESSMWGDYHLREAALYLERIIRQEPYYAFFNCLPA